ncbi:MAG: (2Fe-2S)-binding protein [Clostridia bacterium]|nr:(2Fe-2S)-binding protein [Clostridia bacterium]
MEQEVSIEILRYDPQKDKEPNWQKYYIPVVKKNTVLGALQYIYENIDATLAFRYGCRFNRCGLCAVEINGRPRMACNTYLKDGMRVSPLTKLPLIKDLVIERNNIFNYLANHELYLSQNDETKSLIIKESEQGARLRSCMECLACLSACPQFFYGDQNFAGPYIFVKLAQLYFDPRNTNDRRKQAYLLGITRCQSCQTRCYCPNGIRIYEDAILSLA